MQFLGQFFPQPSRSYCATLCAMIRKDIFLLKSKVIDLFINSSIILCVELITWCYVYPLIGMSNDLILPMFVGWPLLNIMISLGYCFSMKYTLGALYTGYGFMEYDLTLPLPIGYILANYIISFVIEACTATLPLIIIGLMALSWYMNVTFAGSILLFLIVYIMALFLFGITFLALCFYYPNRWFEDNLWPRRISFFVTVGAIFSPWAHIYAYSKPLAIIMLFNPLTYVAEGMRAALLGNNGFIPLWICTLTVLFTIGITTYWMQHSVRKKLDLL